MKSDNGVGSNSFGRQSRSSRGLQGVRRWVRRFNDVHRELLSRQPEPSWGAVAGTTVRLWLERHHVIDKRPAARRRWMIAVLSALVAMAFGAGVTLAFTTTSQPGSSGTQPGGPAQAITPLQVAAANRHAAAVWVAAQVGGNVYVSCDPEMCGEVQQSGFPAGQLNVLQPTAPDPLGGTLVIATPAIQNQFGVRLASVYAPLVIASFGTGAEQVDIRYVPPDGAAAFNAQLAADRKARISAGEQLLGNKNVHAGPAARALLLAGQVDPRLLITLSALASKMPIRLIAFDDSSPGASTAVPLRGAEIGAAASGLPAVLAFLTAQQTTYAPAQKAITRMASGQSVVTVRYDAPSPLDLGGS